MERFQRLTVVSVRGVGGVSEAAFLSLHFDRRLVGFRATEPLGTSWVACSWSTWKGVLILADAADATSRMWRRLCLR